MTAAQLATLHQAISVIDMMGVAVFAITGGLVAARKSMDPFGFVVLGVATGIGGGTLRDLVLGVEPVFWVHNQIYLGICIIAALATFWLARPLASLKGTLAWADAVGMAMFAVVGTQKANALGVPPLVAVTMGVMTASFGGLMRDILAGERPMLFHKEIYATAAIAGSVTFLLLGDVGAPAEIQAGLGFLTAFAVRGAALLWGLSLPHYRGDARA